MRRAYPSRDFIRIDKRKALYWYTTAAQTGLPEAQFQLAEVYREGRIVTQNRDMAIVWYVKAVDAGHDRARAFLHDLFR